MLIAPDSREFCSILGRNLGFEFQNGNEVLCSFLVIEFDNSKTLLSYDVDDNDGNHDHEADNDHVFNYTLYKHCSTFPFFQELSSCPPSSPSLPLGASPIVSSRQSPTSSPNNLQPLRGGLMSRDIRTNQPPVCDVRSPNSLLLAFMLTLMLVATLRAMVAREKVVVN